MLDRAQESALFVTGQQHDLKPTDTVSCKALDQISPLLDVTRRIIARTPNYSGFGCFNFKFGARKMSQQKLDQVLSSIPTLTHDDDDSITTDFGPEGVRHAFSKYGAVPKFFDFNTRLCGSHMRHQTLEAYKMLRLYLDVLASETDE